MRVDSRRRTSGVAARAAALCVAALVALVTLWATGATSASGGVVDEADPLDHIDVLAVSSGDPTRVLFAAPTRLMTQTLTSDDVTATVDGEQRPVRVQRLSATDLELGVVIDTTVDEEELRALQGAVVELALDLPPGATMRIVDATGTASDPVPVPGPAIAQIRQLQADTEDDLQRAVDEAQALLEGATQDRTALLVIGRDLGSRLEPIDDVPLDTSVAYVVPVGTDGAASLGPTASGTVIAAEDLDDVLPAVDDMSVDLRNLYVAEVAVADAGAGTLTLEIPAGEEAARTTVALDPDSVRPVEVDPAAPEDADPAPEPPADTTDDTATPVVGEPAAVSLRRVVAPLGFAVLALIVIALLWSVAPRLRRRRDTSTATPPFAVVDEPPVASGTPRAERPQRPTRPIAKLAPETREALAGAHLGLRRLALASRAVTDHVPDQLFRVSEARASVALAGHDVALDAVLAADLTDPPSSDDVALVHRAATALTTGWQHTARRKATPPPVVEITAVLTGRPTDGTSSPPHRPLAPVRALNPLIEIGLEHVMLAERSDQHSELMARAVTAVEVGRAARLSRPFLTPSTRLLDEAERYRTAIRADLNDPAQRDRWLQLLCSAVALASADCADRVSRLDQLRALYRRQVDDPRLLPLIDLLVAQPMVDNGLVMRRLSVSEDAAAELLAHAGDAGWVRAHPHLRDVQVAEQVISLFRPSHDEPEHDSQPA